MEQVSRWWNGSYGRLSRRDVFLRRGSVWEVEAREGGAEGRSKVFRFASEQEATAFLRRVPDRAGQWRELTVSTAGRESAPGLGRQARPTGPGTPSGAP